ncbi:MAG: hypothetical protein ACHQ0J_13520 [Candidatus Dormibacterales bacterium]
MTARLYLRSIDEAVELDIALRARRREAERIALALNDSTALEVRAVLDQLLARLANLLLEMKP